ncbi:CapA family protein [Halarcobacter ebronensis]|uniref:Capsule synthesis protein CapA domain-containing protein n=1 Tax=Halarcobacter ebronensis TaxID=1462615 RepID=A0A4Q1AW62_9BACT|nr:CapA family protein [Halarcobacter ebronensis]QKF81100.1 CapA family protein [Halarcobacter ebronensis]RXK06404.1 hypothetical protein CRV07_06850 [Halarcobacter ebronensis]
MLKVNNANLRVNDTEDYKFTNILNINITGDWAPSLGNISDILIEKEEAYYGELVKYFHNGDLNIVNLETVIDTQERDFEKSAVRLIDKPEVLSSLKSINTHLACLANNHILDNGAKGLTETIKHLREYKIEYVGAGLSKVDIYKPYLFEKNSQKIAVINTAEGEESNEKYNGHIGASDIESYNIIDQIRECKQQGYFTILIAHAGVEFIPTPPPHIQELYRTFVDEGANLVVGHHPHVPQGLEIYKDVPIFYSLGNFGIFRKKSRYMETIGYLLNINIINNKIFEIKIIPYKISAMSISILRNQEFENFRINFKKSSEYIQNNSILKTIWREYIFFRYLDVRLKNIVKEYSLNSKKFKSSQINFVSQYSEKFMFLEETNKISKFEYLDYLKEFGCIKKLKFSEKIFYFTKDKLYFFETFRKKILKFLVKIERLIKNV